MPDDFRHPNGAPQFASIHTLLRRVDALGDVPTDATTAWVRKRDTRVLEPFTLANVRPTQLSQAIDEGRIYILWDHRFLQFNELGPEWPRHLAPAP